VESAGEHLRAPPLWERGGGSAVGRFLRTSVEVLFRPTRFYRNFATRQPAGASRWFGRVHLGLASVLIGAAAAVHFLWMWRMTPLGVWPSRDLGVGMLALVPVMSVAVYLFIYWTTRLAARLTNWEATYWGLRLPLGVVLRGLDYHTVHYLPVAVVAAGTVIGYQVMLGRGMAGPFSAQKYLYVLSGEIVLSAGYLFQTYWIGMRNMMYANR